MSHSKEYIEWLKGLANQADVFYFKQFKVRDDRSTMKVGTDAVLLGIATEITDTGSILEIGTGSGVISLILAQRSEALIDAIEIDEASVAQATENVAACPWKDRIRVIHSSLQDYASHCALRYQRIVTNPPFFSRSFKSGIEKRNLSRHDDRLTFDELLEAAGCLLDQRGQLWVILPTREGHQFRNKALAAGFHIQHILQIIPREGKEANRLVMAFAREKTMTVTESHLTLRDHHNQFSEEYKTFAHDFYIDF